jgi:hypothetical protein
VSIGRELNASSELKLSFLALKGDQGTPPEDVELYAIEQKTRGFRGTTISRHETRGRSIAANAEINIFAITKTRNHGCQNFQLQIR